MGEIITRQSAELLQPTDCETAFTRRPAVGASLQGKVNCHTLTETAKFCQKGTGNHAIDLIHFSMMIGGNIAAGVSFNAPTNSFCLRFAHDAHVRHDGDRTIKHRNQHL